MISAISIVHAQITERQQPPLKNIAKLNESSKKGWAGKVNLVATLMGEVSNCSGTGACHNQIYAFKNNKELDARELVIQLVYENKQLKGIYMSPPAERGKVFVTTDDIKIQKTLISNAPSGITIKPGKHEIDYSDGQYGTVIFKNIIFSK